MADALLTQGGQQAAAEVVLAAATAWLAPFPPGVNRAAEPSTVAPGSGSRGTVTEISMFRLPSTVTCGRFRMPAR